MAIFLVAGAILAAAAGGAILGSGALNSIGQSLGEVGESAADVAKATARAIESEAEMLLPVVRDPLGREIQLTRTPTGQITIPADGDYSIIGAFDKMLSVPAHQAAFATLIIAKGTEVVKEAIKFRGMVRVAELTGKPPDIVRTIDLRKLDSQQGN